MTHVPRLVTFDQQTQSFAGSHCFVLIDPASNQIIQMKMEYKEGMILGAVYKLGHFVRLSVLNFYPKEIKRVMKITWALSTFHFILKSLNLFIHRRIRTT